MLRKRYNVYVQHPAIEHGGKVYPNIVFLGYAYGTDELEALNVAQAVFDNHSANLIMVEPDNERY